jgi:putative hydroxymethylpyrimidine transport system substrate-binding protein
MRRHLAEIVATVAAALVLAGCGAHAKRTCCDATGIATQPASLVLDFTPNAVHVGIYDAIAHHFDTRSGIRLDVEVPGASTDAISELEAGRVDFAILDIHDLALADQSDPTHPPIVGILPIVEEPLAAVISAPSVRSPQQLAGKTVGVTGDPSDLAVLDSIVRGSGGNPRSVKKIDIGYDAVPDLISGRGAAAPTMWYDQGVGIKNRSPGYHIFRVTHYGAPSYPELVVCATATSLRGHPARARDLVRTLAEGYDHAIAHPAVAAAELEHQVSGLDSSLVSAELPGEIKAFTGSEGRFGVLDMPLLRRWARWEQRFGIVRTVPDVSTMFDTAFAPRG